MVGSPLASSGETLKLHEINAFRVVRIPNLLTDCISLMKPHCTLLDHVRNILFPLETFTLVLCELEDITHRGTTRGVMLTEKCRDSFEWLESKQAKIRHEDS